MTTIRKLTYLCIRKLIQNKIKKMSGITKDELQALRKRIPHGYLSRVSEKIGCSYEWVQKVLKGNISNLNTPSVLRVVKAALEVVKEVEEAQQQEVIDLKSRINELTNETPTARSKPAHYRAGRTAATEAV